MTPTGDRINLAKCGIYINDPGMNALPTAWTVWVVVSTSNMSRTPPRGMLNAYAVRVEAATFVCPSTMVAGEITIPSHGGRSTTGI
jgi:hypothetical protein